MFNISHFMATHSIARRRYIAFSTFLFLLLLHPLLAQRHWIRGNDGATNTLLAVRMLNPREGWTAGGGANVLHTTDGGRTWVRRELGNDFNIRSIAFLDEQRGALVGWGTTSGSKAYVLATSDGGETWTRGTLPPLNTGITKVVASSTVMVALSAQLIVSVDGGMHWGSQELSNGGFNFSPLKTDVAVSPSGTFVMLSSDGRVYSSGASGLGWTFKSWVNDNMTDAGTYVSIAAPTADIVLVLDKWGRMRRSTDGGTTWGQLGDAVQLAGISGSVGFNFFDENDGIVTGSKGLIYETTDAGLTWQSAPSGTQADITSSHFLNRNLGFSAGQSRILRTEDGGVTWTGSPRPIKGEFANVVPVDDNVWYTVGNNGLIARSTNGGNGWEGLTSGTTEHLYGIDFRDAQVGYAVGDKGTLLRTEDGGTTWTQQSDISPTFYLRAVATIGATTVVATGREQGNDGVILRTTDDGATWTTTHVELPESSNQLNTISFADANAGYVIGPTDLIFRTANGGETWTPITVGTEGRRYSAGAFTDAMNGLIGGFNNDGGVILRTTDGGKTWENIFGPLSGQAISAITIHDAENITALHTSGTVYSTDGGATWEDQRDLGIPRGMAFTDAGHGVIVGLQNAVYYTDLNPGSISTVSTSGRRDNGASAISIVPNPLYNRTTINVRIERQSTVTLSIHDATGRRIATLFEGTLPQGDRAFTWDAGETPTGIYFYRLTTDSGISAGTLSVVR